MIRYIFFVTNQSHLLNVAKSLYKNKIAEPVIWIGDDRLYKGAKEIFGDAVLMDLTHRFRNYEINDINYSNEHSEFFKSENYIRAKDISLKMMDRLDLYGQFSRIDREVFFHKLLIFYLKKIYETNPEFLIASEAPHDYPKYIIFEICKFLNIKCFKFNNWNLTPLLVLENMMTNSLVEKDRSNFGKYDKIIDNEFENYFRNLIKPSGFEMVYMKRQRKNSTPINRIRIFLSRGYLEIFRDFKHNFGMILKRKYNPINPYRLGLILRNFIQWKRKRNLFKELRSEKDIINLNSDYIYFPLHFEPERTTNPDGGYFQDQFLTLQTLRKFIPDKVKIIVKEHPSQFLMSSRGSRGRSPLFYNLIKNIQNTSIVYDNYNSIDLIKNSKFVVSISGTVLLEAAFLGIRGISFGSTWYNGCPNITPFSEKLEYNEIINKEIQSPSSIIDFFKKQKEKYAFLGFQNQSQRNNYVEYDNKDFLDFQFESIYNIMVKLFKNDLYKK